MKQARWQDITNTPILVVDDFEPFLDTVREFLENEGFGVVTATTAEEAKRLAGEHQISLAILDLRLTDDKDDKDVGGLDLARELDPTLPKIILTRFPTWEVVRQALGPAVDSPPVATAFIAKQEGLPALLGIVRAALTKLSPAFEQSLLRTFEIEATVQLPMRISELSAEQVSERFHQSLDGARTELRQFRNQEAKRASQHHFAGLLAAAGGLLLLAFSVIVLWLGWGSATWLPMVGAAVVNAIGVLFFVREDAAHRRAHEQLEQLTDLNRIDNLLFIVEGLNSPPERDEYRRRLLDRVLDQWFWVGSAPAEGQERGASNPPSGPAGGQPA